MSFPVVRGPLHQRLLLLGLLLLPAVVALASDLEEGNDELHCACVKTTSQVPARRITSLELIKADRHCAVAQLIATLKNGRKVCLDPQAALYKKVIKKLLDSELPSA